MSTNFSLTSFVRYFSTHDELSVPANQELTISDIEEIHNDPTIYKAVGQARAALVIDRILSVLAKDAIIRISSLEPPEFKSRINPYLFLTCTKDIIIKARAHHTIVCPPEIFFRVMRSCNIFKVSFKRDQEVKFLLGMQENIPESIQEKIALLNTKTPPDCSVRLKCIGTMYSGEASVGGNKEITFGGEDDLTLECIKNPLQFASLSEFCKELEQQVKITLQPHQIISVNIEAFDRIHLFTHRYFPKYLRSSPYWLNQIALLTGRCINIEYCNEWTSTISTKRSKLNISFSEEVTLSLLDNDLVVDLWRLGSQLARSGRPSIQIGKGKKLVIVDPPQQYLDKCLEANGGGIFEFLSCYNPLGFILTVEGIRKITTNARCGNAPVLALEPDPEESLIISLKETTKEQFIMNTLQVMHPEVVRGLQEGDANAIQLLLFNIMAYYLFSDFKVFCPDELPPYLKSDTSEKHPGTLQRMKTLRESKSFSEISQKVLNDKTMNKTLYQILQMTPTAFNEINVEELEPELKTVFLQMQQLVFTELQGSTLTQDALASVARYLAEGNTIQHRPLIL